MSTELNDVFIHSGQADTPPNGDNSNKLADTAWVAAQLAAITSGSQNYVRLPGGLLLQWGQDGPLAAFNENSTYLPISFPTNFAGTPQVFCQTNNRADNQDGSAPYVLNAAPIDITGSGFRACVSCNTVIGGHGAAGITNTVYINWFAIGF